MLGSREATYFFSRSVKFVWLADFSFGVSWALGLAGHMWSEIVEPSRSYAAMCVCRHSYVVPARHLPLSQIFLTIVFLPASGLTPQTL